MTEAEFHSILEKPQLVAHANIDELRELAHKYSYSQIFQLLYAMRLRHSSEHLFDRQLAKTSVLSNDREVLFKIFEEDDYPLLPADKNEKELKETDLKNNRPFGDRPNPFAAATRIFEIDDTPAEVTESNEADNTQESNLVEEEEVAFTIPAAKEKEQAFEESTEDDRQVSESEVPETKLEAEPKEKKTLSADNAKTTPNVSEKVAAILAKNRKLKEELDRVKKGQASKKETNEAPLKSEAPSKPANDSISVEDKSEKSSANEPKELKVSNNAQEQQASEERDELIKEKSVDSETEEKPEETDVEFPLFNPQSPIATTNDSAKEVEAEPNAEEIDLEKGLAEPPKPKSSLAIEHRLEAIRNRLADLQKRMASADTFLAKHQTSEELQAEQEQHKDTNADNQGNEVSHENSQAGEALDEEYLEIEALAAQHQQEDSAPILVDDSLELNESDAIKEESENTNVQEKVSEEQAQDFSFSRWLKQIDQQSDKDSSAVEEDKKPVKTEQDSHVENTKTENENLEFEQKMELLDSFVEKLPDLKKRRDPAPAPQPAKRQFSNQDPSLVTETLAKVYLRQKHYKKALKAYEILKLKYPEKSSFFATQILEIKNLANG